MPKPKPKRKTTRRSRSTATATRSHGRAPTRITDKQRADHLKWALELTSIPTAAGREHRVIHWIEDWLAARKDLSVKRDAVGNMLISIKGAASSARGRSAPTVIFTAHLDHPAFVVTEIRDPRHLVLEFRGGIDERYFDNARLRVYDRDDRAHSGRVIARRKTGRFNEVLAKLAKPAGSIAVNDIATWDLKPAHVKKGILHAPACDDLAGAAAALSALDALRKRRTTGDVRVLLTRAEEVGFIGAIEACENGFIPRKAKVIALENSRSFAESPIGGGPIIRVGDRISVFHHGLLYTLARVADELAKKNPEFRSQRKLMPGGACEATAFQAYGLEAICLCLPLGAYHNMGDIDAVYAGTNTTPPKAAAEFISVRDYHGLIDLLIGAAGELTDVTSEHADGAVSIRDRMAKLRAERGDILKEPASFLR